MSYFKCDPPSAVEHLADAQHYDKGRVIPVQLICLHDTVGTDSLDLLSRQPGSKKSAHRLIKRDGTNYILVNREDTAWTNGPSQWFTAPGTRAHQLSAYLTIEMEHLHSQDPSWPAAQVHAAALTCTYWWSIYGFIPIVSHWNVQANKQDPQGFPWPVFYGFMRDRLKQCLA